MCNYHDDDDGDDADADGDGDDDGGDDDDDDDWVSWEDVIDVNHTFCDKLWTHSHLLT